MDENFDYVDVAAFCDRLCEEAPESVYDDDDE